MNETINNIIPINAKDDIFTTIMPDTYFDDHELGKKMITKLESNNQLDAVVGLFRIRLNNLVNWDSVKLKKIEF